MALSEKDAPTQVQQLRLLAKSGIGGVGVTQALTEAADTIEEHEQINDLRWEADLRGIKKWQAATGKALTWPDHAELVAWLLEQWEAAKCPPTKA